MGLHSEIATRLAGSADLYETTRRPPSASINFVTAHDGFTLQDLVSYEQKHNEANGEENRDGADDNHSWNCGVEGPTDDPGIIELRERQKRNFWCALMFAQGSPMISGGDELSRTQQGNNNAYCQDNELSWYHWDLDEPRARRSWSSRGAWSSTASSIRTFTAMRSTTTIRRRSTPTRTSFGSGRTASAWAPRTGRTAAGCAPSACS